MSEAAVSRAPASAFKDMRALLVRGCIPRERDASTRKYCYDSYANIYTCQYAQFATLHNSFAFASICTA
jgi:hypothetical protein